MRDLHAIQKLTQEYHELFMRRDTSKNDIANNEFLNRWNGFGFAQDRGERFARTYSWEAFYEAGLFEEIWDSIEDMGALGCGIVSKLDYVVNACEKNDLLSLENRDWFLMAFSRMNWLSRVNSKDRFFHEPKDIHIKVGREKIDENGKEKIEPIHEILIGPEKGFIISRVKKGVFRGDMGLHDHWRGIKENRDIADKFRKRFAFETEFRLSDFRVTIYNMESYIQSKYMSGFNDSDIFEKIRKEINEKYWRPDIISLEEKHFGK